MAVFDTSAIVPLFAPAHPHRDAARRLFEDADLVLLHPCVIEEFTRIIRRLHKAIGNDGNREAREALRSLLDQPRVHIHSEMDYTSALELYDSDHRLSFTDAAVAALSHAFDRNAPISFDDRLGAGARPNKTKRPRSGKT